ncbi:MAG: serine/threonine protein kinase [Muribaculaceae bacterium]|nr:serine/threonine protein kinase [Muribaculaceae bacterium]
MKSNESTEPSGCEDSESSGFIYNAEDAKDSGISYILSDKFDNILPLYDSQTGPFRLLSAVRYGKKYVLKCLKNDNSVPSIYEAAFLKEFEIGMSLDHTNVRSTIGIQEIEGIGKAIILEYIDGENLEQFLSRGNITKEKARNILTQICSALGYMHRKQIIHRDLKPSNIMVTHSGETVKIIDFSLSDSDAFMIAKNPAGTLSYMAPEAFEEGYRTDSKADIWSLGKIARLLSEASGDLNLYGIASRCMKKNPNDRPRDVETIVETLKTREKYHLDYFSLRSASLTWVLTITILILLIVVVRLLLSRGLINEVIF